MDPNSYQDRFFKFDKIMNQNEFIESIRIAVIETGYRSMEAFLKNPPGRQPAESSIQLSNWFNSLNATDRENVLLVISESVNTAVFGFCCVLDGVRAIENGTDKGRLLLYYEKNNQQYLLNDPDDDYLHDIL